MKKIAGFTVVLVLCLGLTVQSLSAATIPRIIVDGNLLVLDCSPLVQNDRILVPARAVFEAMGATVQWSSADQSVLVKNGQHTITLFADSRIAQLDGSSVSMDTPCRVAEGRLLIPLRFVGEALEASVGWDERSQTVTISSAPDTSESNPPPSEEEYTYTAPISSVGYIVKDKASLVLALKAGFSSMDTVFYIDYSGYDGDIWADRDEALECAGSELGLETGYYSIWKSIHWELTRAHLKASVDYAYDNSDQLAATRQKVAELVASLVKPGMSDQEVVRVFHDYLVNNCRYDMSVHKASYTAYGALILHKAVCQGYSEAMSMLCIKAGLDCRLIVGTSVASNQSQPHAWNLVNVDGAFRHVDVTFDDPVSDDGADYLFDTYFLLNDQQMSADHRWISTDYPAAP